MEIASYTKGGEPMDYKVVNVMDHYEVYDANGNFICSGDTLNEAAREAERYLIERR